VKAIYEVTAKGDPVRLLMVDLYVYKAGPMTGGVNNLSLFQGTDFLKELVPMFFAQRTKPVCSAPWEWPGAYRFGTTGMAGNMNRRKHAEVVDDDDDVLYNYNWKGKQCERRAFHESEWHESMDETVALILDQLTGIGDL
jgi:hypothetical protein